MPHDDQQNNYKKCLHDIRNMKKLDKERIQNIRNLSHEEKMDIIITFNDVVEHMKEILNFYEKV